MHCDPDKRDRHATVRQVRALVRDYLREDPFGTEAHVYLGDEYRPCDRYSWRAVAARAGGGMQLQIGVRTYGCRWFYRDLVGCLNCGLASASAARSVGAAEIVAQVRAAIEDSVDDLNRVTHICIYGDGSFLSPIEVPAEAVYAVAEVLRATPVRTITMETRLDLVRRNISHIQSVRSIVAPDKRLEVAIGLESSSEFVRNVLFRKGSRRCDVGATLRYLVESDVDVLLYVFLKPSLLTEREAIFDCVRTVCFLHTLAASAPEVRWTAALQPSFVQPHTFLEWLYVKGSFVPPYLWSIAEVLKRTGHGASIVHLGSPNDYPPPIAIPSNRASDGSCCICSPQFYEKLLTYNQHGLVERMFAELPNCPCRSVWAREVDLDHLTIALDSVMC